MVDLPGVLGINIGQSDDVTTRADGSTSTSDGKPLSDGLALEYDLASPDGDEKYHYLLLYDKSDINAKPLVFPIDASNQKKDPNPINNLTLTISKLFVSRESDDLNGNTFISDFTSVDAMKNYMKNTQGYVLLNFKLDKNYEGTLTGNNTIEKLSNLTRSQLESLEMTDFKINASYSTTSDEEVITGKKDYFTMSNSVYSNGSARIVDYNIDTNKIFNNEEQALANPAICVYVERLASKYTVSFDISSMAAVGNNFGPDDKQKITGVTWGDNGLPEIAMEVAVVNMSGAHQGGISFSKDGYNIETRPLPATLKIIGFGVSNLENSTRLMKNINYQTNTTSWKWNDQANNRCYWTHDPHYELRAGTGNFTRIQGYPHQFRLALDADTVTSYHNGYYGTTGYNNYENPIDTYYIGEGDEKTEYTAYNKLGTINVDSKIDGVLLNYKSFDTLLKEFNALNHTPIVTGGDEYDPFYSLENTYFEQAMVTEGADFIWNWQRAPYATTTNLMVMAQITIEGNTDDKETDEDFDKEEEENSGGGVRASTVRTVYLGQNNIFYLHKRNLLNSKLKILNDVMLSGGNAGLQILHGLWDQHARWGGDEPVGSIDTDQTHLDKVAWWEGSKLWFGKIKADLNGNPKYVPSKDSDGKILKDNNGKTIYIPDFDKLEEAKVDKHDSKSADQTDEDLDLDLIPAEISGGDGQALIAPGPNRMGALWKYYLAPEIEKTVSETDDEGNNITKTVIEMDQEHAVEISYNHLVALIHKIIGPVDVYTNGYMYFSVPVPHRYPNNNGSDYWTHIGAFSTVRNNWYNILVDKISRMGTPVDDPNQPIVPVMDIKRSYINMGVKLLDWHKITQDNIPMM